MSEENGQVAATSEGTQAPQEGGQAQPEAGAGTPGSQQPTANTVTLDRTEYNQMLGAIATLQNQLSYLQQGQQAHQQTPEPTPDDLNKMKPHEIVQYFQQQQQPLMEAVMFLSVREEIRDVADKYKDFGEYKQEVLGLASKNTALSIEQAYHIAKSQKAGTKTQEPPAQTQTPPAQTSQKAQEPPPASRTSVPAAATQTSEKSLDPRAAAIAAAKELGYKDDTPVS